MRCNGEALMQRKYTILLEPAEEGGYVVSVPALPGCFTQADSVDQAVDRAREAIAVHIAGLEADGEPVPEEREHPHVRTVEVA